MREDKGSGGIAPHTLKVLLLTTSYPLRKDEVSGIFVKRLAEAMSRRVDVKVLTPCPDRPYRDEAQDSAAVSCFRYAPVSLQRLSHKPGGIPAAFSSDRLRLLLVPGFLIAMLAATFRRTRHCDIIHANWSICGVIGGIAGKLRGIPVVTTLRGQDVNLQNRFLLFKWLNRLCLRLSNAVIGVSESITDRLTEEYPVYAGRIQHIPNGVDPDLLDFGTRHRRVDSLRILHLGSLIPRKDVATIIEAVSAFSGHPGITLDIVGDGPERGRLQELSNEHGLSGHARFHGQVPPERVAEFLRQADTLILASHMEGRPNVVLEAMAAGVSVVASNIEGVDELIEADRTGLLFKPGSAAELTAQLERLLRDPGLGDRLAQNSRRRIIKAGLIWTETARHYEALYRALLETPCAD